MNQIKIGKFISECRKNAGLTQSQLAEQLGITDKAVSKWETGRSMPDVSLFAPLCEILNISLNELIAGEHIADYSIKEKSEEILMNLFLHRKRSKGFMLAIQIISSLLLGIGTAVLFVPSIKQLSPSAGMIATLIGLLALYAGLIGKIKYH